MTMDRLISNCQSVKDDINANIRNGTLCKYLDEEYDSLGDANFTLNVNRELIGLRLWITIGGPTILIDTYNKEVKGHWGLDEYTIPLTNTECDAINEWGQSLCNEVMFSR